MGCRKRTPVKALEFQSALMDSADGQDRLPVPRSVAEQIPPGASLRVILLVDTDEDMDLRAAGLSRFAASYVEEDSVYEALADGPPRR